MVLTADEQAQLDALQAKAAEPEPVTVTKVVTVPADVLDVVRQLVQVHFAQIAPEVYTSFLAAVDASVDEEPASDEPASGEGPPEEGAEAAAEAPPAATAAAEAEAFGTETEPEGSN